MVWLRRTSSTACLVPNRPLRSSSADLLEVPTMTYKKYGEAAFCFYGPTTWNKLPVYLRQAASVDSFKAQLKTYFYTLAFNWLCFFNVFNMLTYYFVFCFSFRFYLPCCFTVDHVHNLLCTNWCPVKHFELHFMYERCYINKVLLLLFQTFLF